MHDLSVAVLSSGSCGNSILVSEGCTQVLIDAGISCREIERRLSLFGIEPTQIDAVMLTHEHTDHVRGLKRFCEEYELPVHGTVGTLSLSPTEGLEVVSFGAGDKFHIGGLTVKSFHVNHFAADPVAFLISSGRKRLGVASDLGSVTHSIIRELKGADTLLLEANYDDELLTNGSYPGFLKEAIRSDHGHLSNADAADLAAHAASANTDRVVLIHLSKENNTPEKAHEAVRQKVAAAGMRLHVNIAEHGRALGPFNLR